MQSADLQESRRLKHCNYSQSLKGRRSHHWSRVELGDDVMQEGCKMCGPRLELLHAVKDDTLAVCLKDSQRNSFEFLFQALHVTKIQV